MNRRLMETIYELFLVGSSASYQLSKQRHHWCRLGLHNSRAAATAYEKSEKRNTVVFLNFTALVLYYASRSETSENKQRL